MKNMFHVLLVLFSYALLAGCVTVQSHPSQKTVIKDPKEAELLLGPHLFADNVLFRMDSYILDSRPGRVDVTNWGDQGVYRLMGTYQLQIHDPCKKHPFGRPDITVIAGKITEIRTNEFDFEGIVATALNEGGTAVYPKGYNGHYQLQGTYTFSRKVHPAYWSLQGIPRSSYAFDYIGGVDLYVTDEVADAFDYDAAIKKAKEKCGTTP